MSMDGATQIPISEFEGRKKAQLKEFVSTVLSGSVNSSTAYLASSTKKCDDDKTSSFCLAFGSFGFS